MARAGCGGAQSERSASECTRRERATGRVERTAATAGRHARPGAAAAAPPLSRQRRTLRAAAVTTIFRALRTLGCRIQHAAAAGLSVQTHRGGIGTRRCPAQGGRPLVVAIQLQCFAREIRAVKEAACGSRRKRTGAAGTDAEAAGHEPRLSATDGGRVRRGREGAHRPPRPGGGEGGAHRTGHDNKTNACTFARDICCGFSCWLCSLSCPLCVCCCCCRCRR